ncbi:flavodoxin domain-containing protein [Vulcaniibacterium tengchongense]|uniref:NADPH--hemoprotein reductase n=1 Tax=Vulcaniibacterium tengchongense TaxID=1273429 RepID=A0A3N4V438_9GAMM|nr:sulfite reductase flavoprotein subunit alpha [Vulcaniibacterium tengchongense]RPE77258.1 sulfite reductase (NADPH) flavoprotein alpha-component [Vulcaniibacterium tengchongense]
MSALPRPAFDRARLGNALALLALASLAFAFAHGHGDWWQAAPRDLRWLAAAAALLGYFGLCAATLRRRAEESAAAVADAPAGADAVLLAWASQTGFARQLAERSAAALRQAGLAVRLAPLHGVDAETLRAHRRALFVVSTTGEGDPPDHALGFTRALLGRELALDRLEYGVLALGDRNYAQFCGFGRRLDRWLQHGGARPLFDRVDVDAGDAGALRHWQHHLGQLAGRADLPDWSPPAYGAWRLRARTWLNPGSVGAPVFHLALEPEDPADLAWQAGDIAEVGPRHGRGEIARWLAAAGLDGDAEVRHGQERLPLAALLARSRLPAPESVHGRAAQAVAEALQPLPHREYSIASLPADGALHLLVRQHRDGDGRLGVGSGWLTAHAGLGDWLDLRVRRNPGFHPPQDDRPLILIGNGTGIAGLRALLKARIAAGHHRNWLLFGERCAASDFHYRDEIEAWQRDGRLQHLDLAFSRVPGPGAGTAYVQHCLGARRERLHEWLAQGAAVYVCGSLQGMAPAVDAVLAEVAGRDTLEAMAADGRYRRDVY